MITRRRMLMGTVAGSVVTVGLPLLDCFLDGNGEALADTGTQIPVRFGTWFWGLGNQSQVFTPKKIGADYDLPPELEPIRHVKQHINVFTGFDAITDDSPNLCHYSGWVTYRTGQAPSSRMHIPGESFDVTIAGKIGGFTRFRQLDAAATGNDRDSVSTAGPNSYNTPEVTPVALYQRLFGAEFQDPNSPTFTKNPAILIRESVLSSVLDQSKELERKVGSADRARLDQYFTGLREVEHQLEHQLVKPEPIEACKVPHEPGDAKGGLDAEILGRRHKLMADLIVMAVACDQTRVFNLLYSNAQAQTVKTGVSGTHHVLTHEEPVDQGLGYQASVHWFTVEAMKHFAYFVKTLASIKEGNGTVLDNTLLFAHSDQQYAKIHSLTGIPAFTAGKAGGRLKTNLHVAGNGDPVTRLPYTVMRAMGVELKSWGAKSNVTYKEVSEILV